MNIIWTTLAIYLVIGATWNFVSSALYWYVRVNIYVKIGRGIITEEMLNDTHVNDACEQYEKQLKKQLMIDENWALNIWERIYTTLLWPTYMGWYGQRFAYERRLGDMLNKKLKERA